MPIDPVEPKITSDCELVAAIKFISSPYWASGNPFPYGTISAMGFNKSNLAAGENVVFNTREHWKAIVLPVIVFLIVVVGARWVVIKSDLLCLLISLDIYST